MERTDLRGPFVARTIAAISVTTARRQRGEQHRQRETPGSHVRTPIVGKTYGVAGRASLVMVPRMQV
jgi:hypothetical protein